MSQEIVNYLVSLAEEVESYEFNVFNKQRYPGDSSDKVNEMWNKNKIIQERMTGDELEKYKKRTVDLNRRVRQRMSSPLLKNYGTAVKILKRA
jgi:hypothetical protein